MVFLKKWKDNWELKSFTKEELADIIIDITIKHLGYEAANLETDLKDEFEADSVDVIAILIYLEDVFKNASSTTRTVIPTDRLGDIEKVEDIFDIIYEVLLDIENKMPRFVKIQPDYEVLSRVKKSKQYTHERLD